MTSEAKRSTASREQLEALWRALLARFVEYLEETPPEKFRASMLSVIAAFLRDSGINADALQRGELHKAVKQLQETTKLPFGAS